MGSSDVALPPADAALLDRVAARIVELRLETPAILMLESARPLTLLASQSLLFFEPLVQSLFGLAEMRRWSELIARRDVVDELVRRIEAASERARSAAAAAVERP